MNLVNCAMTGAFVLSMPQRPEVDRLADYYAKAMMTKPMQWFCLQVHSCLVESSTARHETHRGDSGFAEANVGLQPAAVLKPDRDNYTVQDIMAVYRNPYHQGMLLRRCSIWQAMRTAKRL